MVPQNIRMKSDGPRLFHL